MKTTRTFSALALVTVVVAALTIFSPIPLRAADQAPDSRDTPLCSVEQQPAASDCASSETVPAKNTSIVMLKTDGYYQQSFGPNDSSEALLEELIRNVSTPQ